MARLHPRTRLMGGACAIAAVSLLPMTGHAQQPAAPAAAMTGAIDRAAAQPRLELVATLPHEVTGVTVAADGRIFVNFPRWTEDVPVSVAEVKDGWIRLYPDDDWNSWRNAKQNQIPVENHFVSVQSVVVDGQNNLWVVDTGAPGNERLLPNAPKLVKIDLSANKVAQVIRFDDAVAPQGTSLNDIRFSPDGHFAYLTDANPVRGALIVVDLRSGRGRRVLDGHPFTQVEKDVVVKVDGQELRRPDGRGVAFAADGIALTKDGRTLYWKALTGKTLYRVAAEHLHNANLPATDLETRVEKVGNVGPTDGLLLARDGRMYFSSVEDASVKVWEGDRLFTLVQDRERLRWPDTFTEGPDGAVYVTNSRIPDNAQYKPENGPRIETQLWRIRPGS